MRIEEIIGKHAIEYLNFIHQFSKKICARTQQILGGLFLVPIPELLSADPARAH